MGRLFFDFVLKEWLEVGINLANAHIPCLIVLNQLEVGAAEGQNTDNVQHCRYCTEKVGDLPDKAGRKASSIQQVTEALASACGGEGWTLCVKLTAGARKTDGKLVSAQ